MRKDHYINSFFLIGGKGINVAVSFLFLPYLVRALPIEDYGTYGQVILITEFIKNIIAVGSGTVIQMLYAKKDLTQRDVFKTNIIGALMIGVLGSFLLISFSSLFAKAFENPEIILYLIIYSLSLPMFLLRETLSATHIFFGNARFISIFEMIINILRIAIVIVAIQYFGSLTYVFIGLTILSLFSVFFFSWQLPKDRIWNGSFKRKIFYKQMVTGASIGLSGVVTMTILSTDGFMISFLKGVEDFAIYKAGAIQLPFLSTLYIGVSTAIFPEINKILSNGKKEEIVNLKRKAANLCTFLVFPASMFIMFFHHEFIIAYLSEDFARSAPVFLIYNIAIFIRIGNHRDVLLAFDRANYILTVTIVAAVINIIGNYFMINLMGIEGAALVTLTIFYLLAILLNVKTASILQSSLTKIYDFKSMLIVLVTSLSLAGANYFTFYYLLDGNWIYTIVLILFSVALVYLILIVLLNKRMPELGMLIQKVPLLKRVLSLAGYKP